MQPGQIVSYFLDRPEIIKVSLTNICNYRCVMCYNPGLRQTRGFIKEDLLWRIMDECNEAGIGKISLGATGEPLLHPKFADFLVRAKQQGLWVSTTTNASRLTPEMAAMLFEQGINRVNLSIYSASPDEHRRYTGTDTFDLVVENIRGFLRHWKERGRKIEVNMWFLPISGVNTLESHLAFWKPLADEVGLDITMQPQLNWGGVVDFARTRRFSISRKNGQLTLRWWRRRPCPDICYYLQVLHNGEILPCCQIPEPDPDAQMVFGHMPNDHLMDIWRSARYQQLKQAHAKRRIQDYPVCVACMESRQRHQIAIPRNK